MGGMTKFWVMGILLIALSVGTGCAQYWKNRLQDGADMIDVGLTFSKKPGFAVWYDFVPVVPVGVSYVDGWVVGLGGGKPALWKKHYQRHFGIVAWGQEEVAFGYNRADLQKMTEKQRKEVSHFQRTGLGGLIQGPWPDADYMISCPHYVHLGWIGVIASPRYWQMLDFLLGFTTLDIGFDDDREERLEALFAETPTTCTLKQ